MRAPRFVIRFFVLMLSASIAFAQTGVPPHPPGPAPAPPPDAVSPAVPPSAAPQPPAFSQEQLDQMLAPIALYPDPLLSQILMASTYPLEVVEAARWLQNPQNAALKGDQLSAALAQQPWDPSVKSLVAFPQVMSMLD